MGCNYLLFFKAAVKVKRPPQPGGLVQPREPAPRAEDREGRGRRRGAGTEVGKELKYSDPVCTETVPGLELSQRRCLAVGSPGPAETHVMSPRACSACPSGQ